MGTIRIVGGGMLLGLTAWLVYRSGGMCANRPVPAKTAAQLLQKAWADHHTTA